ncbi:MAG: biopolymer transporter ExbD [Spirosomataceae bacterium]
MPKVKIKRKSVSLDMTAMCDVAFLLLTFFMLTAKFRPQEAAPVVTPSSVSDTKLPEKDIIMITINKEGKIFLGVDAQPVRDGMLQKMGEKYQVQFTPEELQTFRTTDQFGVPIANMKQLLNMPSSERNRPGVQPGIPCDSLKNELFSWVLYARMYNPQLRVAVKGDNDADYKTIEQVVGTLQQQNVNSFNLVTALEHKPIEKKK